MDPVGGGGRFSGGDPPCPHRISPLSSSRERTSAHEQEPVPALATRVGTAPI